jgi:hypothetical protein
MKICNKTRKFIVDVQDYQSEGNMCRDEYLDKTTLSFYCILPAKWGDRFKEGDIVTVNHPSAKPDWDFKVTDVSDLGGGDFGITLEYENIIELESKKEKPCQLDNDCDCDCCNCEKEKKAPVKEDDKPVESIDSMLKKVLSQEDLDKLPKHMVCIFSDGNKDTVAFEMENGNMKGIGIAKRHKKDKFDFYTGAQLAFNRCVGADGCTCDGCHCEDDVIWLHEDDDEPLMDSCGRPLKFGDFVVGHKDGGYYPGVIGRSNNQYYLCYQDKVATPIEEFTDFDLVYRG